MSDRCPVLTVKSGAFERLQEEEEEDEEEQMSGFQSQASLYEEKRMNAEGAHRKRKDEISAAATAASHRQQACGREQYIQKTIRAGGRMRMWSRRKERRRRNPKYLTDSNFPEIPQRSDSSKTCSSHRNRSNSSGTPSPHKEKMRTGISIADFSCLPGPAAGSLAVGLSPGGEDPARTLHDLPCPPMGEALLDCCPVEILGQC